MAPTQSDKLLLRVKSISWEAQSICAFEMVAIDGAMLPAFSAGAHIDLHLPNGLVRSYSLLNDQSERNRYVIGVNRDPASRGGSRLMHESLRPGDTLTVTPPRNNFELNEDADQSVFIAGGIGITPILGMIRRLNALGKDWRLYYCARTRKNAAFLSELRALQGDREDRIVYNYDGEFGGKLLDMAAVIGPSADNAHFYCCGPLPMLKAFEQATGLLPGEQVHVEYFTAAEPPSLEGGFTVELAKSARTLTIPQGKSILDAVLDAGIQVPYSCMEGVCGSCETAVLDGVPEHRDLILSKDERASNKTMLICCSGSKGGKLVLDL